MNHWLVASLAALLGAAPATAQDISLSFIGQQTVAPGTAAFGTTVGGLSGIDYDPTTGRYIAISDDQVNARFYSLDLNLTSTAFTGVSFTGVTTLKGPNGAPYAANTIDPEAIRFSSPNTVVYTSEGFANSGVAPFVREANINGTFTRDFTIPAYYNPALGSGIRNNLAFESVTLGSGGSVVTATENALVQDGPAASFGVGSPSRILQFSTSSTSPIAEYVYQNDPVAVAPGAGAFSVNGLVELLSLGGTQYLALERSFTAGAPGTGYSIKLYGIDTALASNVLGLPSIPATGLTPVSKTLLFDLGTLGVPLDNIEGMTFGEALETGQRSLVLVADDNFAATQTQQFLAFSVGTVGAVPEPATWAMMLLGFGAVGLSMRRSKMTTRVRSA